MDITINAPRLLEANKKLIYRLFEAINTGDFAAIEEHPGFWETRQVVPPMQLLFSDWQIVQMQQLAEGDLVATRLLLQGTHEGPLYGLAPTGKTLTWDLFSFARLTHGTIVEHHFNVDWLVAMINLGLVTSPEEAPATA